MKSAVYPLKLAPLLLLLTAVQVAVSAPFDSVQVSTSVPLTSDLNKISPDDAQFLSLVASFGHSSDNRVDVSKLIETGVSKDLFSALGQLPADLKAKLVRNSSDPLTIEEFQRLCYSSDWCELLPEPLLLQLIRTNLAAAMDPVASLKNPPAMLRVVNVVVRSGSNSASDGQVMLDVLERTTLPDVYWFVKAVTRLAKVNVSWMGNLDRIWGSNRRIVEFQFEDALENSIVSAAILNSSAIEADIRQNNRLTELGMVERITWANTVYKALPINVSFANTFYHPLIVGYPEKAVADWLSPWSQEKHNQSLALLTSPGNMLTVPQVQRLAAKFLWKPNTMSNPSVRKFRLDVLDKLDVTQLDDLGNITVSELKSKPDLAYQTLLKLINNDLGGVGIPRFIPKGLANLSLTAYPATQMMAAVASKDLEVDKSALVNITTPYLSLAQCLVLFESYVRNLMKASMASGSSATADYLNIPEELLKCMPYYPIVGLDESVQVKDRLFPLLGRLNGMLPSQRMAIVWKLSQLANNPSLIIDKKADVPSFATGALTSSFNSTRIIRFMSSKVYQMASLFEKLQLQQSSSFVALNPLSGISCSVLELMDTSKIVSIMSTYDLMVSAGSSDKTIIFLRPSERKCFMAKFKKYLAMKGEIAAAVPSQSPFSMLTSDEVLSVGGSFFTNLTLQDLRDDLQDPVLAQVVFTLGRVSPPQLMPLTKPEWLEATAKLFMDRQGLSSDRYTLASLTSLGNLAMFLGEDMLQFKPDHLKLWLEVSLGSAGRGRLSKCACLPSKHAVGLKKALYLAYGAPNSWTASQILSVSNLLWVLGDDLKGLNQEEFRRASPFLLKTSCSSMDFDYFPGFVGNGVPYDQACYRWLGGEGHESAERYKANLDKLMRMLLVSSQMSVDLASAAPGQTPGANVQGPPESRADTSPGQTNSPDTANLMYNKTLALIKDKYLTNALTKEQQSALSVVSDNLSKEYKDKASSVLGIPAGGIEINQLAKLKNISAIQMQMIREEGKKLQKHYMFEVIKILKLSHVDYSVSREDFCAVVSCEQPASNTFKVQLPFVIKYDPEFASGSDLGGLIRGTSSASMADSLASPTITCNGIVAAGISGRSLRASDLSAWTTRDLFFCIDVFGRTRFPAEVRDEIWDLLFSKTGDLILDTSGQLRGATMIFLRQMLDTIALRNPTILTWDRLKSIDAISVLGTFDLPSNVTKAFGDSYVAQNFPNNNWGKQVTEGLAVELATLGQLFCDLPTELVELVVRSPEARNVRLLGALGGIRRCQNRQVLSILADQADKELEGKWSSFDVSTMGIIVAGLTPQKLSSLPPELFGSLTSPALAQLTAEQILALRPLQIRALPSEALGALTLEQMPLGHGSPIVDEDQMAAFEGLAAEDDGFAKVLLDYKEALKKLDLQTMPPVAVVHDVKVDRVDEQKQQQQQVVEPVSSETAAPPTTEPVVTTGVPQTTAAPEATVASSASKQLNGFEMFVLSVILFTSYLYLLVCCLEGH